VLPSLLAWPLIAAAAVSPSAAAAATLVLPVAPVSIPGAEASRPLALARAENGLRRARHDYADSRFDRCTTTLALVENELAANVRGPDDLGLLKRVNQWWGLCAAARERGAAEAAFGRAIRLPGPEPDPDLFSPSLLEQYRAAGRARPTCIWSEPPPRGELDGTVPVVGARVEAGEHYFVVSADPPRSGRVFVLRGPDERCSLKAVPLPRPVAAISVEESVDLGFLAEVGRTAGVPRVATVAAIDGRVAVTVVDVATATIVERKEQLVPPGETPASVARAQLVPGAAPAAAIAPLRAEAAPPVASRPWYGRWWVWGAVAAVAAGTAAALVISGREPAAPRPGERRYDVGF
jgi:hypothetical protein